MVDTVTLPSFATLPTNGVVSLRLENAGATTLGAGIATFGQVFEQGDVPAGKGIAATAGGQATGIQMDVKSTYADGSVKYAVFSVERPELAAGTAVDVVLSTTAKTAAAAIDLTNALNGHQFTVDIVTTSGTTHVDVLGALASALADGTASVWQEGSLSTQARVEVMLAGSQRLVFDVTAFKGGGFEVEAQFNNDRAMESVGGRVAYTAVVTMDGHQVANQALDQAQYQNWHETFSSNGRDGGQGLGEPTAGWLNIQHDTRYLEATGAISPYNFDQAVAASTLNTWYQATQQTGWGDPFAANGLTQYMPMTGGRGDIGITTAANTAWMLTQDARAAAYAMGQAEAASGIPWNFRDAAHDTWLSTDYYAALWTDPRGGTGRPGDPRSTGLTQQVATDTGWTPETAHAPNLSYIPYLQTGERWLLDNLNAQASWAIMATYPTSRQNAADLLATGGQVRAAAWSLREVQEAAFANPDGSVESAYFSGAASANWAWLVSKIPEWTLRQGEAHGWLPGAYADPGATATWQQDYFALVAIDAARQGNADARTFLEWQSNFLIGRFMVEDQGFLPSDGTAYRIATSDATTGTWYSTWEEIAAATVARGWSTGGQYLTENYTQLALATLAGIYELTGSHDAAVAFWKVARAAPTFSSEAAYLSNPTNAFALPPMDDGGIGEVLPPDSLAGGATTDQTVNGTTGNDTLSGGAGNDTMDGKKGADSLVGGGGDDTMDGGDGADTLLGGGGNDRLKGGLGIDSMVGGIGDDVYYVDHISDRAIEAPGAGDDLVIASVSYTLGSDIERLTLTSNAGLSGTGNALDNVLTGNNGANLISGLGGADTLTGCSGADTLLGGDGDDRLLGGAGNDSMVGGTGYDVYYVDNAGDQVLEAAGGGNDLVIASVNYTLGSNVERLTFAAAGGLTGIGNALENTMIGNQLDNVLSGLDGNDLLYGMDGADTLLGGNGNDKLLGNEGDDYLNGGNDTDTLFGGDGNDRLVGGAGNDSMVGGNGDDVYYVDDVGDRILEGAGGGNDLVIASVSYTLASNVERLTFAAAGGLTGVGNALENTITGNQLDNVVFGLDGADLLYGMAGADTLVGGNGNDRLVGNEGNDLLIGGAGNDVLTGSGGADAFRFIGANAGWDRITDFTPGTDRIELQQSGFSATVPVGVLSNAAFHFGSAATAGGEQFLYDQATGTLRWDADGVGSGNAVVVAVLSGAPALQASDLWVVAALPPQPPESFELI